MGNRFINMTVSTNPINITSSWNKGLILTLTRQEFGNGHKRNDLLIFSNPDVLKMFKLNCHLNTESLVSAIRVRDVEEGISP